jgi:hypothetical protein
VKGEVGYSPTSPSTSAFEPEPTETGATPSSVAANGHKVGDREASGPMSTSGLIRDGKGPKPITANPISPILVAEPDSLDPAPAPGTPIVTITPPIESSETFPSSPAVERQPDPPAKASTIDEAVANFHEAIDKAPGTTSDERQVSPLPRPDSPAPAILDEIAETDGESIQAGRKGSATLGLDAINGHSAPTSEEETAPQYRRHPSSGKLSRQSTVEVPPLEVSEVPEDAEGATMDEIDLN